MELTATGLDRAAAFLDRATHLHARYRAGKCACMCRRRCATAALARRSGRAASAGVARARWRPRRAACSSRCRSRSIRPNRSGRISPIVDRDAGGRALPLPRHGRADRHARVRRKRSGRRPGRARVAAVRRLALRALGIPDGAVAAPQGRAEPHRAGRHAAALHRQHRRRGGRERDQGGAAQPRDDVGRRRRRLHRLVRGRVSRPHARQPRRDAPQEGAARVSDVRLAAHPVSGRGPPIAEGDGAARRAQPEAAVGSAGVRPAAARGEEQGHLPPRDGRARRVPGAAPGRDVDAFVPAQRAA